MNKTFKGPGLPDTAFFRGKAPMTKSEVRAVTLSKLKLHREAKVLDIGAGSGSITVEAALQVPDGHVWGIERKEDAYAILLENMKRFDIKNMTTIKGLAPEDLPEEIFDAIFVGGSAGQMHSIVDYAKDHLHQGGRLVVNLITVENLAKALEAMKSDAFEDLDIVHMQVSKGRPVGTVTMMEALNPIYIVSATKK